MKMREKKVEVIVKNVIGNVLGKLLMPNIVITEEIIKTKIENLFTGTNNVVAVQYVMKKDGGY